MKKRILGGLFGLALIASSVLAGCGKKEAVSVNVAALKGPTTMGLVKLMDDSDKGNTFDKYEVTMYTQPDEVLKEVIAGNADIALVPANMASVLYNKTEGGVSVIDINTLGVLYLVSADTSIKSLADLEGRTVCMTGKGATPEYAFSYLLDKAGLTDKVNVEFKSEATEVVAYLASGEDTVGILPQPFVTAACLQNESLSPVLDLSALWDEASDDGSRLVTGVTLVRNDFLKEHKDAVTEFIKQHGASVDYVNANAAEAGELVAAAGIVEKAPVAAKAIPGCNLVCISGSEMKNTLSGYLAVLAGQDPAMVGGSLPGDDFYFLP